MRSPGEIESAMEMITGQSWTVQMFDTANLGRILRHGARLCYTLQRFISPLCSAVFPLADWKDSHPSQASHQYTKVSGLIGHSVCAVQKGSLTVVSVTT